MLRRNDFARWRCVLSALWLAFGVAGCACFDRGGSHATPSAERDDIVVHTWRALTQVPQEAWSGPRTALYTYVLMGDVGGNAAADAGAAAQDARLALGELLKEVQAGQPVTSISDRELLARVNKFCVPARGDGSGRLTLERYDFDLASAYLNRVRLVMLLPEMAERLGGAGPFLVGTRKPLAEIVARTADGKLSVKTASPLLLMDLSGMHRKSMPTYVIAYKEAVRHIDPSQTALLQPLRPHIASVLLKMNEALPFVAVAYAGTQKRFGALSPAQ